MDLQIKDLRVVITAAANGIGAKIAEAFAREGARVVVCDIDKVAVAAFTAAHPSIPASVCDVTDRTAVKAFFDDALKRLGGLDCLVNNAGIAGPTGTVGDIHPEDWDRCVEVCTTSQFNCTRLVVEDLKRSKNGSIINLSSAAGKFGFPGRSPYAAAKWGVIGFTKSISRELGPYGVRCNAVLPGMVEGDRVRRVIEAKAQMLGKSFAEMKADWMQLTSIKELVQPEQIADMVVFLASPRARTVSGQAISVDGDMQTAL